MEGAFSNHETSISQSTTYYEGILTIFFVLVSSHLLNLLAEFGSFPFFEFSNYTLNPHLVAFLGIF